MPGPSGASVSNRWSAGQRLSTRSTLDVPPGTVESPKLNRITGSPRPASMNAW